MTGPWRCVTPIALLLSACGLVWGEGPRYSSFDRLYIKLKEPVPPIAPRGTLVLLLYHRYPTSLTDLRIAGSSPGLVVDSADPAVDELLPTSMIEVPVRVMLNRKAPSDTAELTLLIKANEVARPATLRFRIPLTSEGAARLAQQTATPVGEIEVRVSPHRDYQFAVYVTVTAVLIAALVWRRLQVERSHG
jgi:hypothetical protein